MDLPGISTVSYFNPRKATDNFLRLCRLITEPCSDLLRIVFSHYIKPSDLRKELDNNKTKLEKILNAQQRDLVYPATGNPTLAVKDFDISILYILLRNICNIPKHKNGWGNDPNKGDNSIAACIERIRCQRNVIVAHSNGMVEDTKFENSWSELQDAIVEIEKQLIGGKFFEGSVEYLHDCDICIAQRGMTQREDKCVQANLQPANIELDINPLDTLGTFYEDDGRSIRFANLFDEISQSVPHEKIHQMKDFIQHSCKIGNIAGLKNAVSARDCLTILTDANLFNSKDVICIQYLMKKIGCEELFTKCYEYAETENVLCFHEKPLEDECKNVYFHVHGEFADYGPRQIEKIKATVAAAVGCSSDKILVGGICPSSSFLLVLSIKNAYVGKLLEIGQEYKAKLKKLNVDYFIIDLTIVHLECPKEKVWNIYYGPNDGDLSKNFLKHFKKGQTTMSYLQKAITALPAQSHDLPQKDFGDSSTGFHCVKEGIMAIALQPEEQQSLKQMICGSSKLRLTLLYKVSRDGCSAWTFHTKCDSQGPTITVIYNTKGTVYGGYTSESWLGAGAEYGAHDEKAFLFQVRYKGKSVQYKFPIKADKYAYAIACHHSFGPVFGQGDPNMPYFTGKKNPSNGVYTLTTVKVGTVYDMKSTDISAFTNDSVEVNDIEVYKVDEKEFQPTLHSWRLTPKFDNQLQQMLRRDVEEFTPVEETGVEQVKILLTGQVKAGKSSFINTIISIFKGDISSQAPSGSVGKSLTTKFRNYGVKKGKSGPTLNFKLCDTKGLEIDDGIDPVEFGYILDGNMPDKYLFNSSKQFSADSPGFIATPSPKDRIHVVVFVMDATSVYTFPPAITDKIKSLQAKINQREIPQVVLLTQIDKICEGLQWDLSKTFSIPAIGDLVDKTADLLGLPRAHILPVKNYEREMEPQQDINILALLALRQMLNFADDCLVSNKHNG